MEKFLKFPEIEENYIKKFIKLCKNNNHHTFITVDQVIKVTKDTKDITRAS